MAIHTVDMTTIQAQDTYHLSIILIITAINRGQLHGGMMNVSCLTDYFKHLESLPTISAEDSQMLTGPISTESAAKIATYLPGLTLTLEDTASYLPALDPKSIQTAIAGLQSLLFDKEQAHSVEYREILLPYAGNAPRILAQLGVDTACLSSPDLTIATLNRLHQNALDSFHLASPSSTPAPEAFIRQHLEAAQQQSTDNHAKAHGVIINIDGHFFAAGYAQGYFYCFKGTQNQLVYSTSIDELTTDIASYFRADTLMSMSATPITVTGTLQAQDVKSSEHLSSSSSSSSASSSTSPVTMSPTIVPDSGATSPSASLIAISAGLTQPNAWKTEAELAKLEVELGYGPMDFVTLHLPSGETRTDYATPESTWAQSFLPNLWIGNIFAVLRHYTTQDDHHKYDVIIDLSNRDLGQYEIKPFGEHTQISVLDNGTNDLFRALDEKKIFEKIDTARADGKKVLINCSAGQSRSTSAIIKYLIRTYNISFVQAYHHLKAHRPEINPNPGYVKLLLAYEDTLGQVIAPIDIKIAQAWLDELEESSCAKLRQDLNDSGVSTITRVNDQINLKISDHKITFVKLITFLKLKGLPFQLAECDAHFGNIVISQHTYTQLMEQLSSSVAATQSLTTDSTPVSTSGASSSSAPHYSAASSSSGPSSSSSAAANIPMMLRRYLNSLRKPDTSILSSEEKGVLISSLENITLPNSFKYFSTLLTAEGMTIAQAKQLIDLLNSLDGLERSIHDVDDNELINESIKYYIKCMGDTAPGLMSSDKSDMTYGDLRARIEKCSKEGLPKRPETGSISAPVTFFNPEPQRVSYIETDGSGVEFKIEIVSDAHSTFRDSRQQQASTSADAADAISLFTEPPQCFYGADLRTAAIVHNRWFNFTIPGTQASRDDAEQTSALPPSSSP